MHVRLECVRRRRSEGLQAKGGAAKPHALVLNTNTSATCPPVEGQRWSAIGFEESLHWYRRWRWADSRLLLVLKGLNVEDVVE